MSLISYVNIEGVLSDFYGSACKLYGRNFDSLDRKIGDNNIARLLGVSELDFVTRIHCCRNFWESVPCLPHAQALLASLSEYGAVVLVSGLSWCGPTGLNGKLTWIAQHFPKVFNSRHFVFLSHKYLLAAHSRAVLVDESIDQLEHFADCGGSPIFWFTGKTHDANMVQLSFLRSELARIMEETHA